MPWHSPEQSATAASATTASRSAWLDGLVRCVSLSRLLRVFGAAVLVASVSVFLLQGWQTGNDVNRYLLLLAHTVLLAGTGFVSGRWIKETKGARLFLAMALVSVSVNFAILGGLVYSQFQWDSALGVYPDFATWRADAPLTTLAVAAAAILVLAPVAWLGFLVLARRSALPLTALYLTANAALLAPVRESEAVAALLIVVTLPALVRVVAAGRRDRSLATAEGIFARTVQFLPAGILLARSVYLYAPDAVLLTVASLCVYLAVRQLSQQAHPASVVRSGLELFATIPAAATAMGTAAVVAETWPNAGAWVLPLSSLVFAGLTLELSLRSLRRGAALRRAAALAVALGMLGNLLLFGSVLTAAACLLAGLLVTIYGYSVRQRVVLALGLLTLLAGLGYHVRYAIEFVDIGSWASLALLGMLAILAGSVLERRGAAIVARLSHWKLRFATWDY